ncbi:MAG TPA: hypothetical protein DEQ34_14325 [Balneolaceae bacterium]|nr:hypothetical protein [Balneolaceae bacterium]|tara:strand:- start:61778 stop:63373 length:1596 start_codon:yes stop_codon:yes gene_type:complete
MRISFIVVALLLLGSSVHAQVIGPIDSNFDSFRQNGVSTIESTGDTLWISPALNTYVDGFTDSWIAPEGLDSIYNGVGRVFSLDVNGDTVVAGLGYTASTAVGNQPAGYGYYLSTDGGDSWQFSDFYLDRYVDEDTTFIYGGTEYIRERVIVPEQSPPYSVAFKGDVIFSANWASGLLRSTDFGASWERIVLPPFGTSLLTPERNDYEWFDCIETSNGVCTQSQNVYNSVQDDNLKGFAVFIDSKDRVWFGSAGGINISENALSAPTDSVIWKNINFKNEADGLLSRWIIEIDEDPTTGRVWMTNWIAESSSSIYAGLDNYGIVFTEDGGLTFGQRLIGEQIFGISFKDNYVFAAGANGLFISRDGGDSWYKSPRIVSENNILKPSVQFQSVAATNDKIWVATTDGIISSDNYGDTWQIHRVNFPLSGGNVYDDEAATVSSYAYPNPYSPEQHDIVRIRFEVKDQNNVRVRIFDFGMNLVRDIENGSRSPGNYEAIWDGLDGRGRRVANGPYFYIIEMGSRKVTGKILLIE